MSDPSAANAIRLELGWTKRQAMFFIRLNKDEAYKHAKAQNISMKEALIRLARQKSDIPRDKIEEMLQEGARQAREFEELRRQQELTQEQATRRLGDE